MEGLGGIFGVFKQHAAPFPRIDIGNRLRKCPPVTSKVFHHNVILFRHASLNDREGSCESVILNLLVEGAFSCHMERARDDPLNVISEQDKISV
jgi:hypothetical protein